MSFDPTPLDVLWSVATWVILFGVTTILVLLVSAFICLIRSGEFHAPFRFLYWQPLARSASLAGVVAGLTGGALLGVYYANNLAETATERLKIEAIRQITDWSTPLKAVIAAVAFGLFGGLLLGPVVSACRMSWRRVWALSMLTFRESVRRKVLWIFVLFALLYMFGDWFLDKQALRSDLQIKNHVSFVLRTISWLVLPVVLLLSCWGLPEDIKARSLHTVVTKPARKNEVLMGRIMGFTLVGTLLLVVMGTVGYGWIVRGLPENARSDLVARVPIYGALTFRDSEGRPDKKGINVGDVWDFRSFIEGLTRARAIWTFDNLKPSQFDESILIETRFESFRTHKGKQGQQLRCVIHFSRDLKEQTALAIAAVKQEAFRPLEDFVRDGEFDNAARELRRLADGVATDQIRIASAEMDMIRNGMNSFVDLLRPFEPSGDAWVPPLISAARKLSAAAGEKGSARLAEAMTELADVMERHAADMQSNLVNMVYSHPEFEVREYKGNVIEIPRRIRYRIGKDTGRSGDLLTDLAHGGRLSVQVECLDAGQYLGMARPDLFIRLRNRPFWVGYLKSQFGAWLMMLLVIVLGVTASTFLKFPVATLLTFFVIVLGSNPAHEFFSKLTKGELKGSGTAESSVRLYKQMNPQTPLEVSGQEVIARFDEVVRGILWCVHKFIPDFNSFRMAPYVANGFDVSWHAAVLPSIATVLMFLIPCLLVGNYTLQIRELEAK